jgi:hypothetical protein
LLEQLEVLIYRLSFLLVYIFAAGSEVDYSLFYFINVFYYDHTLRIEEAANVRTTPVYGYDTQREAIQ